MAQALVDAPSQGVFIRDRNVSVDDRPHPGYDPNLWHVGAFTVLPKLTAGVEENDNIYARQTNKDADTIFALTPEVDLNSDWRRNALQAFFRLPVRQYVKFSTESTTDWQLGGAGRYDIARGSVNITGDIGELTEPRTSNITARNSVRPIRFTQSDFAAGGVQDFGLIRISARYDFQRQDYHNGLDNTGAVVFEDYRTHDSHTVTGKAEYAMSPAASFFIDTSYNLQRYDLPNSALVLNRDAQGGFVDFGASFELSSLIRGQLQIGYLRQTFQQSVFSPIEGISAQGKLEWFPTQLTTVTLNGYRGVQDSGIIGSSAYVVETIGGRVDHELFRNLILTGGVSYDNDVFNGIDRRDHVLNATVGARYRMNRLVGLSLDHAYLDESSVGAPLALGPLYVVNRITLTTRLTF